MQAFYDLAYAEGLIEISTEQLENARLQLKRMERQHELGMKPKSDLFDIQAQVAESEYNLIANQNRKATALVTLKQAMNYEEEKEGLLDINVSSLSSALPQNQELDIKALYEKAQTDLPQANSAERAFRAAQLNWYITKGNLFPSFSAYGDISTYYYHTQDASYTYQFRNNMGKSFGFQVNIPIFGGLYRHSNVARAKYQMKDAEFAYRETLQDVYKEIELAVLDLKAASQEFDMAIKRKISVNYLTKRTKRNTNKGW